MSVHSTIFRIWISIFPQPPFPAVVLDVGFWQIFRLTDGNLPRKVFHLDFHLSLFKNLKNEIPNQNPLTPEIEKCKQMFMTKKFLIVGHCWLNETLENSVCLFCLLACHIRHIQLKSNTISILKLETITMECAVNVEWRTFFLSFVVRLWLKFVQFYWQHSDGIDANKNKCLFINSFPFHHPAH